MQIRDLTIVGAGPAGLAAGIAAKRFGLDYSIVEKGVLVNSIFKFPVNMVFFTTPELLEIGGLPLVSPYDKPTRAEALRYYRRVVDAYDLQIAYQEKVLSVEREPGGSDGAGGPGGVSESNGAEASGDDGHVFAIETLSASGVRRARYARHVVM